MTTSAYDMLRHVAAGPAADSPSTLPLAVLHRDPTQPRQTFDEASLADLAASIKHSGIIEPLVVTPHPDREGEWIILVGERRCRAAEKAGLQTVPVTVRMEVSEVDRLILQLSENDQRTDLKLREKAEGYMRLRSMMPEKTTEQLAAMLGKKRTALSNTMLAAKVTAGAAFEALEEDLIKDPDALRLFLNLPGEDQKKLLATARASAVTLSRPMLQRFKEGKRQTTNAAPQRTAPPSPQPSDVAASQLDTDSKARLDPDDLTASSRRAEPPAQAPAAAKTRTANEYLAALTWRHWEVLFKALEIPLPEDPDDAGYTLLEFLEAKAVAS
ncbi:MAG TPA: ParB/RepB/Spo0J family partition protein [Thermoanaerobaculia bacterium]|nr:ParB/RepB/Spo0J family partition protein [Thermoanaerobaculia bacterium]